MFPARTVASALRIHALVAFVLLLAASSALAQSATGDIQGTVIDQSAAPSRASW
jgi:hypothetical protein